MEGTIEFEVLNKGVCDENYCNMIAKSFVDCISRKVKIVGNVKVKINVPTEANEKFLAEEKLFLEATELKEAKEKVALAKKAAEEAQEELTFAEEAVIQAAIEEEAAEEAEAEVIEAINKDIDKFS